MNSEKFMDNCKIIAEKLGGKLEIRLSKAGPYMVHETPVVKLGEIDIELDITIIRSLTKGHEVYIWDAQGRLGREHLFHVVSNTVDGINKLVREIKNSLKKFQDENYSGV